MINGRILALDVGDARVGLALSDPLGLTAQPLVTLEKNRDKVFDSIASIILTQDVRTVLIGLPLELSGKIGPQAEKVRLFSEKLGRFLANKQIDVPFEFLDERMTTVEASLALQESGLKNRDRRAALDRISAAILLEAYLQSNSRGD